MAVARSVIRGGSWRTMKLRRKRAGESSRGRGAGFDLAGGGRFVAGFNHRDGFQVILAGTFKRAAVEHPVDEVPLQRVNAVSGETAAVVRIFEFTGRTAKR